MNRAQKLAAEIAAHFGSKPRRCIDTEYNDVCWVALERPNNAIVVYEDDANRRVETGNHNGRFKDVAK